MAYFGALAGPHRAVVECVQSWYWLRDLLAPCGVDLRLAHAKYVKAISYAKVKTDRVDARMLAQLLRAGLIPEAHMIGAEHRETRDLLLAPEDQPKPAGTPDRREREFGCSQTAGVLAQSPAAVPASRSEPRR